MIKRLRLSLKSHFVAMIALLCCLGSTAIAAQPDLTAGGVPDPSNNRTSNLGPTGLRGWVYYLSGNRADSSESRQISVSHVESGSPADGIIAINDVILGADGTGANPVNFSSDARKSLAYAIQDAEASSPAELKLLRWRNNSTTTVTITLQTMGAYTATAPYNCPKSTLILQQGMQYVYDNESVGKYSFGGITHLATGDPAHLAKAQTAARALASSQSYLDYLKADEPDLDTNLPAWDRGHKLLFLAEYYLATSDSQVLPAVEAYALNVCKNRSLFGTFGHGFAEWKNGPIGGGYGTVNSAGLPCLLGVLLAKECGLTNPELDPAIEAANRFFAWYSGKGAIPYGDHMPQALSHENNGKSGLGAVYFGLQANRGEEGKFFAKMSTAAASEREIGHTGSFFNYLWAPLGAAQGGEEAAAAHFGRISWMLDLNRCWDGRFQYDCLNGEGPASGPGATYHDFRMSTAALLTYALPHRQLRITGKGHDVGRWLTSTDVTEALQAEDYDPDLLSNSQLISDLGNWSARVRQLAAEKLGTNGVSSTELIDITALATDTNGSSRPGACLALGQCADSSSSAVLAGLLTDSDNYVRYSAAEGMRYLPTSANLVHLDTVLAAAASTAAPLLPLNEEDPQHMAHSRLALLLFYNGGAQGPKGLIGDGVDGVDRNLLYPAIKAVAETPVGMARSTLEKIYQYLSYDDVLALSGTILDSIVTHAPADRMFSHGVRYGGASTLLKYNIAEGVPACMMYAADTYGGLRTQPFGLLGDYGGSVYTVTPDPGVVEFIELSKDDLEIGDRIKEILAQIDADTNPTPLVVLKSIQSVSADNSILTLPANSTVLRISSINHVQDDSIYTWRKTLGPGGVSISPNGTSDTVSTLQFDGTPGTYQFEVTMSDSRGFTEVYETVTVFLREDGEVDDDPPLPNPASFLTAPAADSKTAVSMTAANGIDVSGPVEYLFTETTGNPGGSSSSWQTSASYTDSGLSPFTQYAYMITMRDSLGNTGTTSGAVSVTTQGTLPPTDIISVNFYAYSALQSSDYGAVTIEADESAGFGAWNTAGWENYAVPWGLSSPASAVSLSSGLSATATLTLNDQRNGGPYVHDTPHVLLPGDGNGDLMDGHSNGTEDPGDGSNKFDMTVSNISLDTYDVIIYLGANRDQFGDGTGKIVLNGGNAQDFSLTRGGFYAFAEITNPTAPGNYILYKNVTGSSFTVQLWGNGFNHIGPTGFQIASAGSTADANPPSPNSASFATPPNANGTTAISMTATTGSDASGPIEYLFSCLTVGGHGSGWQTSPSYTDSGLTPNTLYSYTVTMRDSLGNTGNASAPVSAATDPVIPFFGIITYNDNSSDIGTVPVDGTSYSLGDSVTVLGNIGNLTKTGHTFSGWNTAANGSGVGYAGGANFTITVDATLYAQWSANSYTISFDSVGGSVVLSITQDYGTAVTAPAHPTRTGYGFTGWDSALPTTMLATNLSLTAQWITNTAPSVDTGPDQTVTITKTPNPTPPSEWRYSAWTGDADSGIDSNYTYTAAHCFGNTKGGSVTVNGASFVESEELSGSGWSIAEAVSNYDDTGGNLTGSSKELATECIYFTSSITVTFEGLTVGQRYQATFYSVAWGNGMNTHTLVMTGGDSLEVDRNVYGDSNGIKISCDYTATGTTQEFTLNPAPDLFPLFAMANREDRVAITTLDGTVTDADGDVPTTTWSKVSGPGTVEFADASAVDTTAIFAATPGTYVLRLTADDGYGPVSHDVTITVSLSSPPSATYTAWASKTFTNPFNDTDLNSDSDGDGRNNFWEFAFGTDPTLSQLGSLAADGSAHGAPIPVTDDGGTTFDFLFVRRDDHGTSGSLTYTVQFSSDLETFYDSGDTPTVVADSSADADYEVVQVPYPASLPNGQKATFGRVIVVESP